LQVKGLNKIKNEQISHLLVFNLQVRAEGLFLRQYVQRISPTTISNHRRSAALQHEQHVLVNPPKRDSLCRVIGIEYLD
jgi:hypothetical protein